MNAPDLEQGVRDSNQRLQRIEQILPTLATKEELHAAVAPLATKEELRTAIAPLATKEELRAAVAPLATKEELRTAMAPLATKEELRSAVETLSIEIREGNESNLRQFQILAEGLRSEMRLIADSFMGRFQIHEREHDGLGRQVANHEDRITRLEATRRRPRH